MNVRIGMTILKIVNKSKPDLFREIQGDFAGYNCWLFCDSLTICWQKFYEKSRNHWNSMSYGIYLCPEQDSNLHASQHSHLKRARLPFRHLGLCSRAFPLLRCKVTACFWISQIFEAIFLLRSAKMVYWQGMEVRSICSMAFRNSVREPTRLLTITTITWVGDLSTGLRW